MNAWFLSFCFLLGLAVAHEGENIQDGLLVETYHMDPTLTDQGAGRMEVMKRHKEQQWRAMLQCYAEGGCQDMYGRESEGEAECVDGFARDYPCRNVDLLSMTSMADLGYEDPFLPGDQDRELNDIWGWVDPQDQQEYALVGMSGGTSFVRVTDPRNPEVLFFLYNFVESVPRIWRDIKIIGNVAYIGADTDGHGIQVVDLTRLRGRTPDQFEYIDPDFHYREIGRTHNLVSNADSNMIYAVGGKRDQGCLAGLHMIDVSEPLVPKFAGCYGEDGYVHDAECVMYRGPDERYQGEEVCFCYNEDSFTIVDVSDKENPFMIGKKGYVGSAYVHQGWLNDAQTIAISNDELDEVNIGDDATTRTLIWDVSDLENPTLRTIYRSTETAIDHNLYLVGDLVFQSNYEAGLRILHLNEERFTMREVGYFDLHPARTAVEFGGTWSNYPYFPSQNVVVTSMNFGLFIVRPDWDGIRAEINQFLN